MKYLEAFLREVESSQKPLGREPAKPSKPPFAGFAGSDRGDIGAKESREAEATSRPEPGHLALVVTERRPVAPPVRIAPADVVTDPELFIEKALGDLAAWVEAENRGYPHWAHDLLDEKLERLKLCGVVAMVRRIQ